VVPVWLMCRELLSSQVDTDATDPRGVTPGIRALLLLLALELMVDVAAARVLVTAGAVCLG